jgi:hypothetical protein
LLTDVPVLPGIGARQLRARTGEGLSEWLSEALSGDQAGRYVLEIDYREYAEAEAALGWLNWRAHLRLQQPLIPAAVVGPLLEELDRRLTETGAEIAHPKVFAQAATGYVKASICRNGDEPSVEGALDASPAPQYEIVVNLRARAAAGRSGQCRPGIAGMRFSASTTGT